MKTYFNDTTYIAKSVAGLNFQLLTCVWQDYFLKTERRLAETKSWSIVLLYFYCIILHANVVNPLAPSFHSKNSMVICLTNISNKDSKFSRNSEASNYYKILRKCFFCTIWTMMLSADSSIKSHTVVLPVVKGSREYLHCTNQLRYVSIKIVNSFSTLRCSDKEC